MRKLFAIALMTVSLGGCVAVWGQAYSIDSSTSDSVTIKYDRNFTSLGEVEGVAQSHCGSYRKKAVKTEETSSFWGLNTVYFDCVKS